MARSILTLKDPEKLAIKNRFGKMVRWIGEHAIPKEVLISLYGDDNPIIALLDEDPRTEIPMIEAVSFSVFNRAMKGDMKAVAFIRDTMGEKPATNVNVSAGEGTTTLSTLSEAELKRLMTVIGAKVPEVIEVEADNAEELFGGKPDDESNT